MLLSCSHPTYFSYLWFTVTIRTSPLLLCEMFDEGVLHGKRSEITDGDLVYRTQLYTIL